MTQISKATFNTTYADPAGTFSDNTTRDVSEADLRQFAEDIKDSCLFKLDNVITKVTGTISSAQLLTLGSVPVTIISAPGADKYIAIHRIFVSFKYNSVAYDFSSGESPYFKWTSIFAGYGIDYTEINASTDFNMYLDSFAINGSYNLKIPTNEALRLTTVAGTDPSVGNSDLDVVVWYSIEDTNV